MTTFSWGHLRPIISTIICLLTVQPDLHITLFVPLHLSRLTDAELKRWELDSKHTSRLRLVRYGMADGKELEGPLTGLEETPRHFASAFVNVKENYPKLLTGEDLMDVETGKVVGGLKIPPRAVFYEYLVGAVALGTMDEIHKGFPGITKPAYICTSALPPSFMDLYISDRNDPPLVQNILGDITAGSSPREAWKKYFDDNDSLINVRGCEPMHAYEIPGSVSLESSIEGFTPVRDSDASFTDACLYSLPPSLSDDIPKTRNVPIRKEYMVGPLLPPRSTAKHGEVEGWMDEMQEKYGTGSLSFGSLYFAPTSEQLPSLIKALAKRQKPAMFVMGNAPAALKDQLDESVRTHGNGLLLAPDWVEQQ
ncbi:MAG: hypothetical protein TREMPRED_000186, partial [Tremellales sp. Tagirdzhanova-0007]